MLDAQRVLPAFADSDRLLKYFMTKPTSTGCARAKAAISAVLQLKATLRAAPLLAGALTSSGEAPPTNELLQAVVSNLESEELCAMEARINAVVDDEAVFRKRTSQRMLECLFAIKYARSHTAALASPQRQSSSQSSDAPPPVLLSQVQGVLVHRRGTRDASRLDDRDGGSRRRVRRRVCASTAPPSLAQQPTSESNIRTAGFHISPPPSSLFETASSCPSPPPWFRLRLFLLASPLVAQARAKRPQARLDGAARLPSHAAHCPARRHRECGLHQDCLAGAPSASVARPRSFLLPNAYSPSTIRLPSESSACTSLAHLPRRPRRPSRARRTSSCSSQRARRR